jgi:hypothetical protein
VTPLFCLANCHRRSPPPQAEVKESSTRLPQAEVKESSTRLPQAEVKESSTRLPQAEVKASFSPARHLRSVHA